MSIKIGSLPELVARRVETCKSEVFSASERGKPLLWQEKRYGGEGISVEGVIGFDKRCEFGHFTLGYDVCVEPFLVAPLAFEGTRGGEALVEDSSLHKVLARLSRMFQINGDGFAVSHACSVHIAAAIDKKVFDIVRFKIISDAIDKIPFTIPAEV